MRYLFALCCTVVLAVPASAETMLFDFGNSGLQTLTPGWNNVIYPNPDPAPPLLVVFNSLGDVVNGVTLEVTDQFFINGPPSQLGSEAPAGDAASYPVSATDDYFFGHTGPFAGAGDNPYGEVKLTGLTPGYRYDFTFFSSRTGVHDNRETMFTVTGTNSDFGVVATSNNDTEVLHLDNIFPDANQEIYIGVEAGPNNDNGNEFFYINLMQVDVIADITPGDANGDGKVDGIDYLIWAANFGDNPADDPPGSPLNGDFNEDRVVNGLDYLLWAANFGQGPNDSVAIPEPATLSTALFAVLTLLLPPRRRY